MTDHTKTFLLMKADGLPEHVVQAIAALYQIRGPKSGVNNLLQLWLISELEGRLEIEESLQIFCNQELVKLVPKEVI